LALFKETPTLEVAVDEKMWMSCLTLEKSFKITQIHEENTLAGAASVGPQLQQGDNTARA
jgi:hypothetical protein